MEKLRLSSACRKYLTLENESLAEFARQYRLLIPEDKDYLTKAFEEQGIEIEAA